MEIWFGIANGQIWSIFDRDNCLPHSSVRVLLFHRYFLVLFSEMKYHILMCDSFPLEVPQLGASNEYPQ